MLLVNKADLLTRQQRREWARHFEKEGLRAVFWSALAESNRLDAEEKVTLNVSLMCPYIYIVFLKRLEILLKSHLAS